MVASSLIRLPGSHYVLGSLYSQATVHLAVSVASEFRTGTESTDMSGNLPADCRHTRHREVSMDKTLFNSTLEDVESQVTYNHLIEVPKRSQHAH
jgi:hypothetical protein